MGRRPRIPLPDGISMWTTGRRVARTSSVMTKRLIVSRRSPLRRKRETTSKSSLNIHVNCSQERVP